MSELNDIKIGFERGGKCVPKKCVLERVVLFRKEEYKDLIN